MNYANFDKSAAGAFAFAERAIAEGHRVKLEKVAGSWRVIFSPV